MRALRLAVAAALAAAASGAALAPAAAAACSSTGRADLAGGPWLALRPQFSSGPAAVTLVAAPPFAPDLLYASNGVQVVRSTDAGCSWKAVLDVAGLGSLSTVRALAAPSSANSSQYLYVGLDTGVAGGLSRPEVRVSRNRGDDWLPTAPNGSLPPVGVVRSLTASPRLPQTAYALIEQQAAGQTLRSSVWATGDGGGTWQERTLPTETRAADLLLSGPQRENALAALRAGEVRRSSDGGRTFQPAGPVDVVALDQAPGGGGSRLVGGRGSTNGIVRSDDGGDSWYALPAPARPARVAMAPLQDLVALGDGRSTWLLPRVGGAVEVASTLAAPDQLQLSAPTAAGFALVGVGGGAVLRSTYTLARRPIPPQVLRPVRLLPFDPVGQFPSTLAPVQTAVSLPVGGAEVTPYQLFLPRTPSPLDVMFLLDTTGSMGPVIDGLRQGVAAIVSALNGSGLDVRVGLGDFKDYPSPYGGGGSDDYPYRLDRRIGVADASLARAIEALQATGGGDGPESALTALFQSATGKGDVVQGHRFVAPGGQAGYRARTVRLDVLSTDVEFRERGDDDFSGTLRELGHTVPEVVRVLRAKDVHVVGLDAGGAREDLERVAAGTSTFAPQGGVDCDGDGQAELRAGAALVCGIGGATGGGGVGVGVDANTGTGAGSVSLAGAVIGLAEALPDRQRVAVRVSRGAANARIVSRAVHDGVNLKADNELAYRVRLSCPQAAGPGTRAVELAASAGGRVVATASVSLTCVGSGVAGPVAPPGAEPVDVPPADPNGAAAPPAQPPNAPNPNPNPNPNANPNANPNVNANVGAASQEQQTQQLALVQSEATGWQETEELAMSRPAPLLPAGLFVGAAGLLLAVACLTVRARSAPAPAVQDAGG